jgi:3-hydroxyacyl-CoA dehydrogenase/3a,7a,12a-trihydroxy-5b-cholest-24-enoyl-CoA hydratase
MSDQLRWDGRVALVTGAGSGLGRTYALLLASRGCKVVVNDFGGKVHGIGGSSEPLAQRVVEEIVAAGGTAVSDAHSVEKGAEVVQTAIDAFGRLDIVINNAGIAFPKSFEKITQEEWDRMVRVHLTGTFSVTQAAWGHFKAQRYGRVVMTSSPAGLYGTLGASPYCATKMAGTSISPYGAFFI